jgi:hypothetical protein
MDAPSSTLILCAARLHLEIGVKRVCNAAKLRSQPPDIAIRGRATLLVNLQYFLMD